MGQNTVRQWNRAHGLCCPYPRGRPQHLRLLMLCMKVTQLESGFGWAFLAPTLRCPGRSSPTCVFKDAWSSSYSIFLNSPANSMRESFRPCSVKWRENHWKRPHWTVPSPCSQSSSSSRMGPNLHPLAARLCGDSFPPHLWRASLSSLSLPLCLRTSTKKWVWEVKGDTLLSRGGGPGVSMPGSMEVEPGTTRLKGGGDCVGISFICVYTALLDHKGLLGWGRGVLTFREW